MRTSAGFELTGTSGNTRIHKRPARLNLTRDILSRLHHAGKKSKLVQADTDIAFEFTPDCIPSQRLAR